MPEPRFCYRHRDRETLLSCSDCGRPICAECMTPAAVGIRCPEHAGGPKSASRPRMRISRIGAGTPALVTRVMIGINVAVYAAELATGSGVNAASGWIFEHFSLVTTAILGNELVGVSQGDWWRLLTAAFLHYGPLHLGMNMLALWWFGGALEETLGRVRFLVLYLVSGLAGSAGALLYTPNSVTVGASGVIFGILGAAFVLERRGAMIFGGQALGLIVLNLALTVAFRSYISLGGHAGGLVGGAATMYAYLHLRRSERLGLVAAAGVGALAVAVAYWKARGYA